MYPFIWSFYQRNFPGNAKKSCNEDIQFEDSRIFEPIGYFGICSFCRYNIVVNFGIQRHSAFYGACFGGNKLYLRYIFWG